MDRVTPPTQPQRSRCTLRPVPAHLTEATDSTAASTASYSTGCEKPPARPLLGPRPSGCTHWSLGQFKARAVREAFKGVIRR